MRVGSLFSGYGGLDLAVGGDLQWYSEIEPAACQVLEAHHPGVPNLGNITKVDWSTVPPVDIITGGYPCQPFSTAGHRKGKDDERHLWPFVRDAIRTLGPRYAILENVRGHLTLGFADVLADLAQIGWDAEWAVVPASAIGACHRRERIFIVAHPNSDGLSMVCGASKTSTERHQSAAESDWSFIANTPSSVRSQHEHSSEAVGSATESGKCVGATANTESASAGQNNAEGRLSLQLGGGSGVTWGQYAQAIQRWEYILERPAPEPTVVGRTGKPLLNPVFVEWMMGLPKGWVTGHGLSPAQCLKMLGNGVVPQQANYAITQLLARIS